MNPLPALLSAALVTAQGAPAPQQPVFAETDRVIERDGLRFVDLNANNDLDPYEDWRLDADQRARDLVGRMTLAEKAGALMHGTAPSGYDPDAPPVYDLEAFREMNHDQHVNSVISRLSGDGATLAEANNALQAVARQSRLGVPVTISTDPRNHFQFTEGASVAPSGFSQWPETLGLAATGDPVVTRRFAEIARQEYRAAGMHMALSPMADLATEPRWPRNNGTFGEDPQTVADHVAAYVTGFQNGSDGLNADSVITVVKHWVGYGAAPDGWDGHNHYGRFSQLDDETLEQHIAPFRAAFAAGAAGVMPTYNVLLGAAFEGEPLEPVGAGYNSVLLTDMLRGVHGFDGLVLSDWGITNDCAENCIEGNTPHGPQDIGMPWGVEDLSVTERFARGLVAGLDQFGGTTAADRVIDAVRQGLVTESRLDESVIRVMTTKFSLGLFENPYVDVEEAARTVGSAAFQAEAEVAQRRSVVLLERGAPLAAGARVWLHGVSAQAARDAGLVPVDSLDEADGAILRIAAPFETLHPNHFFGRMQHEGDLDFPEDSADLAAVRQAAEHVPTMVSVSLDRPAVLSQIKPLSDTLLADFGASDGVLLEVMMGQVEPGGRLPFALPASMDQVRAQHPGRPDDIDDPLYPRGFTAADR